MSFPIRKIGMLEMPKIAMLSTAGNAENCDAVYNFPLSLNLICFYILSRIITQHAVINSNNQLHLMKTQILHSDVLYRPVSHFSKSKCKS